MDIRLEGLEEVLEKLDEIADPSKLKGVLNQSCMLVEKSAKQNAPKASGDLARSIQSKVEDTEGIVYTNLEYAPYVEFGTGLFAEGGGRTDVPWVYQDDQGNWHSTTGQSPQPYMRPALQENRDRIVKLFKEGLLK